MIAVEISTPGAPDVLKPVERPDPKPGRGEVLIRVAAAGVNRPDVMQRRGVYPPPPGASDLPGLEVLNYAEARQRFERDYLVGLLKITDGNVADAARLAERNRTEFYRLLQKHGLTPGLFRDQPPVAE